MRFGVARKFIGNEPFAVLLGDDIVRAEKPCLKQMMEQYERYNATIPWSSNRQRRGSFKVWNNGWKYN